MSRDFYYNFLQLENKHFKTVHTKSNDEGVARVKKENGNYAFMMESVPMEYRTNRDCELMQVGDLLDSKGYGIALPIGRSSVDSNRLKSSIKCRCRFAVSKGFQRTNSKAVGDWRLKRPEK